MGRKGVGAAVVEAEGGAGVAWAEDQCAPTASPDKSQSWPWKATDF